MIEGALQVVKKSIIKSIEDIGTEIDLQIKSLLKDKIHVSSDLIEGHMHVGKGHYFAATSSFFGSVLASVVVSVFLSCAFASEGFFADLSSSPFLGAA